MTERQQERECVIFANKFENEIKNLYANSMNEVVDYNITFAECSQKWLERIKRDHSLRYYEMNITTVNWANEYLGQLKMRNITPLIIQEFFDKLDTLKRTITVVKIKPAIRDVMK